MFSSLLIIENIPLGNNLPFFKIFKLKFISLDLSSITPFNLKSFSLLFPNAICKIFFIVHFKSIERELKEKLELSDLGIVNSGFYISHAIGCRK